MIALRQTLRDWPIDYSGNLFRIRFNAISRYNVPQKDNSPLEDTAFRRLQLQSSRTQAMKYGLEPDNVFLKRLAEYDDVIDVHTAGFPSQPRQD